MALRLRRGPNADRLAIIPLEGELVYTTDTKKIFAGDGSTQGGNIVSGINNVIEDPSPQLGGALDLNAHNIVGTGDIDITGTISVDTIVSNLTGSVFSDTSVMLVDGLNGKIILDYNDLIDLSDVADTNIASQGEVLTWHNGKWRPRPVEQATTGVVNGDIKGSVFGDDSTPLVDGVNNKIGLTNNTIADFGNVELNTLQNNDLLTYSTNTETWNNISSIPFYKFPYDTSGNVYGQDNVVMINTADRFIDAEAVVGNLYGTLYGTGSVVAFDYNTFTFNFQNNPLTSLSDVYEGEQGLQDADVLVYETQSEVWVPSSARGIFQPAVTSIKGNVYGVDGTLLVDAQNNNVNLNNAIIYTSVVGDLKGSVFADDSVTIVDSVNNIVSAQQGNFEILSSSQSFTANTILTSSITSTGTASFNTAEFVNISSSVINGTFLADDDSIMIDPANKNIVAENVYGNYLVGNVIGKVLSNTSTTLIDPDTSTATFQNADIYALNSEVLTTTSFYVDTVGILNGEPQVTLDVEHDFQIRGETYPAALDGPTASFVAYNLTGTTQTPLVANDPIGSLRYKGVQNSPQGEFEQVLAWIQATLVSAGTGSDYGRAELEFNLPVGPTPSDIRVIKMHADQTITANGYTANSLADVSARSTAFPTPVPGTIIFVADADGLGNPKFQGWTGAGWVDLH